VPIPEEMKFTCDLSAVKGCGLVVMATPSFAVRSTAAQVKDLLDPGTIVVSVSKGIEKDSSPEEIAAAADKLSGLCQAADGALSAVPADMVEKISKSLDADPAAQPFGEEAIAGLEQAKQRVNELHSGSHYHLMIKNDIQSLNDCIQYPVLYNIWKYRVREQDSVRSFRDFIRIYNDGM